MEVSEQTNESIELNFETLSKILSQESNDILDNFIEDVHCSIESLTFLDIAEYILQHLEEYGKVEIALGKELKDYDVAFDDEDGLTDEGQDFLIQYIHYTIHRQEYEEWRQSVGM